MRDELFVCVTNDSPEGFLGEVGVGWSRLMPAAAWDERVLLPHSPQHQEEAEQLKGDCVVRKKLGVAHLALLSLRR